MKKIVALILMCIVCLNAKQTISQGVYKQLQKANKLMEEKKHKEARTILNTLVKGEQTALEKSYAYQSLANIALKEDKYKLAAKSYEKVVKLNSLEKEDIIKIKYSLSQIYLSESMYKKSILLSQELLKSGFEKQNHLKENLALAYFHDGQYKKSIPYIKETIAKKKKKENWYRMLYSAYVESKNYKSAISTLKFMVQKYSKNETYWMQLVSLYQTTKQYKKSLATLELIYENKVVSQKKNILYLVNILVQNEIYNKAALFVEEGLTKGILEKNDKHFEILVSTLLNAKNYKKAIPLLTKSSFAKKDKFQLMLGNIYYNKGKYKSAVDTLKNHKFRKNSKYDGQRCTIIALSFYELDNKKSSKKYLQIASKNKYEKKRAKSLARSLGYKI